MVWPTAVPPGGTDLDAPIQRADALTAPARFALYAVLLLASLAYNFSFILIDYVRPFLVQDLHFSLRCTAPRAPE